MNNQRILAQGGSDVELWFQVKKRILNVYRPRPLQFNYTGKEVGLNIEFVTEKDAVPRLTDKN